MPICSYNVFMRHIIVNIIIINIIYYTINNINIQSLGIIEYWYYTITVIFVLKYVLIVKQ